MRRALLRLVLGVVGALVLASALVHAATGTLTVTTADVGVDDQGRNLGITKYTLAWTSSAGGAVSGNAFGVKRGQLLQIKFVPGTGGSQPTDLYDITLVDTDGLDVLAGAGADLSQTTPRAVLWNPNVFNDAAQQLDLVVANAGNAKSGTVYLWVK